MALKKFNIESDSQRFVMDTIARKSVKGIPAALVHIMEIELLERIAGVSPGAYIKNPEQTYLKCLYNVGVNFVDQYIPRNPLSMKREGYDSDTVKGSTTGAENIVCDGMIIDSPEAVAEHLEKIELPRLKQSIKDFNKDKPAESIIDQEIKIQSELGPSILKTGYDFIGFPCFRYFQYGYVNYFTAYALYPELIEKDFILQADYWELYNSAAARAIVECGLPLMYRLDHDMADSRGTLVDIKSLEKIWFPHFERSIKPVMNTGMNLLWHCDGNLMGMVPLLIDCGVKGFQGFQYEDGMDYKKICRMKAKDGDSLLINAGVSVTTTLPKGTPEDVKNEMKWLVDNGPETGLFLSASSSIAPGTSHKNVLTFIEGIEYYKKNGRH
ncbi:MAG: hypothetical protein KKH91_07125 [Elusimicrobia bacterium]|nr:hypothetical protein [Elusimicrobiota bacterium]MBU2614329.1 hypothetical protein [Elusimicrobiota bacterium]